MQKAVGCQCPYGTVLDKAANKCVKKENCGMNNTKSTLLFTLDNTL